MSYRQIKNTTSDYKRTPEEIKEDYESVIREQKNRILKLREDNAELAKQLSEYEKYSAQIADTLLDARSKASEIVSDAKKRAAEILKDADEQKARSDRTIKYYKSSLKELEQKSERILSFIQSELAKENTPVLSIVNQ